MTGKFYGIGVGPGNSELLTLKAYRTLQKVDIICIPKSKMEKDSLAFSIVQQELDREFEILEIVFPMSHDADVLEKHWSEGAELIAEKLLAGKNVAFITIGDPMFFSTYAYALDKIRQRYPQIPVETIPGVTAFSACSSMLNNPVAEQDEKIAILSAAYDLSELRDVLTKFENVIMMKVNKNYDLIVELLKELKLLDKAVFISRCGHPDEFYTTNVEELVGKTKDYMSILMVKKNGWRGL
jgi:precorrin-2/cobalt-factor-2 C20-methyltransferase